MLELEPMTYIYIAAGCLVGGLLVGFIFGRRGSTAVQLRKIARTMSATNGILSEMNGKIPDENKE